MRHGQFFLIGSLGAILTLASGCTKNETSQPSAVASMGDGKGTAPASTVAKKDNIALVRFVNATPSSKYLEFGDETPFTNIHARDITNYKSLPAERRDFKLMQDLNAATPIATSSQGLTAGKHYTVVAVTSKDGTFSLDPISDDLTPPAPGKAKVRVINLDPVADTVDLYAGDSKDALISGAGLDHPTDYKEIVPSDETLNVRNSLSNKNAEFVKDMHLEAGKLYTIVVFGDKDGKLKVKTVEDVFVDAPNGTKS